MWCRSMAYVILLTLCFAYGAFCQENATEFLRRYNTEARTYRYVSGQANWEYNTNITSDTNARLIETTLRVSKYFAKVSENATKINQTGENEDTKRQLSLILSSATSKNETIVKRVTTLKANLKQMYSKGCVPARASQVPTLNGTWNGTKCLPLDPDLYKILGKSRNYTELEFAWKGWRDATGPKMKSVYRDFVDALNIGARENGWKDYGEYVRSWYEVGDELESIAEKLWLDLKPFYDELHAYVRFKLRKQYPEIKENGPIPAHLLGNMWAQSWVNVYDLVVPFPAEPNLDISPKLKQIYGGNITGMFRKAEEFFTSIGWMKLPGGFWTKSMLEKPKDGRSVVCHASAWDFAVKNPDQDVRVKMCTSPNQVDFITVHHELGHIYYYLWYWDLAYEYRTGANPGFHEAVGDTLALSVQTPQHLHKVGLLDSLPSNNRSAINFLLKSALSKIAFLPFGYLMDKWRWKVWDGSTKMDDYNKKWWELRTHFQGIFPPVNRSEADFDPGAKYHIPGNTPYIRYFMSFVYQFHFHKAACIAAKHTGTLDTCSIYQSKEAGKKFSDMLKLGKSKKWTVAFKELTGYTNLTAEPIKGYFKVLYDWMKEQRGIYKYPIGWSASPAPTNPPITKKPATKKPTTKDPSAAPQLTVSLLVCFTAALAFIFKLY